MKPLVVGSREDVAGFALAGVEGVVCATRAEAAEAVARADENTLLILSQQFAVETPPRVLRVVLPARE